jgi:hypothetical protein
MGVLYLKDAIHDFAVFPFPPSPQFNYGTLIDLADEIYRSKPATTRTSTSTVSSSAPSSKLSDALGKETKRESLLTETLWFDLAGKHLGFNDEQAAVYWDAFCVFLGPSKCHVSLDADNSSTTTSSMYQTTTANQSKQSQDTDDQNGSNDANNTPILSWTRRATPSAIEFLLLLFNQLSHRPSTTMHSTSVLKGDEYPFPFAHLPNNPNSRPHNSSYAFSHEFHRSRSSSVVEYNNVSDEVTKERPTSASTSSSKTQTSVASSSSSNGGGAGAGGASSSSSTITQVGGRVPQSVVGGRVSLTDFWRTYSVRWLWLIHVLRKGRSIDTTFLHQQQHHHHNTPSSLGAGLVWNGIEGLEMDEGDLEVLNFLFWGMEPLSDEERDAAVRDYRLWLSSHIDSLKKLHHQQNLHHHNQHHHNQYHDGVVNTDSVLPTGHLSSVVDVFLSMNYNASWMTQGHGPSSSAEWKVPLGAVASWIGWSLKSSPSNFKKLKISEHGIAYGIEEDAGFAGNVEDPGKFPLFFCNSPRHRNRLCRAVS